MCTKMKMGVHNKITKERYAQIRRAIAEGMEREKIMLQYNISESTLRKVKRSETYYAYQLATEKLPRGGKIPTVICPVAGVAYEDIKPNGIRPKKTTALGQKPSQTIINITTKSTNMTPGIIATMLMIGLIIGTVIAHNFIK